MTEEDTNIDERTDDSFEASQRRSDAIEAGLRENPAKYRVLTGDRPTGALHIGHYFGSLRNRVRIQGLGVEVYIIVADYQVLTDRDSTDSIPANVQELVLDYLAAGLDPDSGRTFVFCHSQVPALNQLLVPFLTLVTMGELDRNPTVKEEIEAAGLTTVNAGMYTYPVHQAADILFCKGNVVPVGKDQLSHLELTRKIARRFNRRYAKKAPVFPEPEALLSEAPKILGLDGSQKMSKSRNNAIALGATADETAKLVKRATTDTERRITYDPENRPAVSNLVGLVALCTGEKPEVVADRIGDGGGGTLKAALTTALNDTLAPLRAKRAELAKDARDVVRHVLARGNARANEVADRTLREVRSAMHMVYE
ncbi:MAG: tryptophan--tRNA ligase [Deltaproteobacteria bacterium]|nr:tryptophan--tRNA ligase [Deltaproteobacteria bacterium]